MKRILLAGVAALSLGVVAGPARAQWAVYDAKSDLSRTLEAVKSLQQAYQQYQMLQAQYRQLEATYNRIAHATGLGDIAGALGGMSRSYLPYGSEIGSALSIAQGGAYGNVGSMLGSARSFLSSNRLYQSPVQDSWAREQERREGVTANYQALAQESMYEADQRLANLSLLQARLEAAQDGTEVAAVQGLIAVEQQNLQIHQARFANLQAMADADRRVTEQRQEQLQRQQAEELRAATNVTLVDIR